MSTFDYLAGLANNLATLAATTITPSSEDTNFDADNVGVGWPAKPFKFNAAGADDTLDFNWGSAKTPTMLSIHGHNIDSGITSITVLSDDNASFTSPVTEATITFANLASPTHYVLMPSYTSHQYMRIKFNGTNGNPISIGEVGAGAKQQLGATVIGWAPINTMPQNRQPEGPTAQALATNLSDHPQRSGTVRLLCKSLADYREVQTELRVGTAFGEEPLICIPDPDDDIVLHARVKQDIRWERNGDLYTANVFLQEDPFSMALPA